MSSKVFLASIAFCLYFSSFAFSQLPTPDAVKAVQILEEYREKQIPLWMSDFGNLARYRDASAKVEPPSAREERVIFLGDSITDGWDLAKYFPGKPYINRGVGGQTTPQMLIRFRPDVIDLQPKVLIILAGTNDIAGNTGLMSLGEIEGNLKSMTELAHLHGIRVVLSSVTPDNNYTERSRSCFFRFARPTRSSSSIAG